MIYFDTFILFWLRPGTTSCWFPETPVGYRVSQNILDEGSSPQTVIQISEFYRNTIFRGVLFMPGGMIGF